MQPDPPGSTVANPSAKVPGAPLAAGRALRAPHRHSLRLYGSVLCNRNPLRPQRPLSDGLGLGS